MHAPSSFIRRQKSEETGRKRHRKRTMKIEKLLQIAKEDPIEVTRDVGHAFSRLADLIGWEDAERGWGIKEEQTLLEERRLLKLNFDGERCACISLLSATREGDPKGGLPLALAMWAGRGGKDEENSLLLHPDGTSILRKILDELCPIEHQQRVQAFDPDDEISLDLYGDDRSGQLGKKRQAIIDAAILAEWTMFYNSVHRNILKRLKDHIKDVPESERTPKVKRALDALNKAVEQLESEGRNQQQTSIKALAKAGEKLGKSLEALI